MSRLPDIEEDEEFSINYVDMDEGIVTMDDGQTYEVVSFLDIDGEEADFIENVDRVLIRVPGGGYVEVWVDLEPVVYH